MVEHMGTLVTGFMGCGRTSASGCEGFGAKVRVGEEIGTVG